MQVSLIDTDSLFVKFLGLTMLPSKKQLQWKGPDIKLNQNLD